MKNLKKVVMLLAMSALGLTGCDLIKKDNPKTPDTPETPACETHTDLNHDGKCDTCGHEGMEVHHVDTNDDGKCDVCQADIVVVDARLDLTDAKTVYVKGDTFTDYGVKVVATMSDEEEEELDCEVDGSAFNGNEVGEYEISVKFDKNGTETTLTYTVEVTFWAEADLEAINSNTLFYYSQKAMPFIPGLKVTKAEDGELELKKENATEDDVRNLALAFNNFVSVQTSASGTLFAIQFTENVLEEADEALLAQKYGFAEGASIYWDTLWSYDANEEYYLYKQNNFIFGLDTDGNLKVVEFANDCYVEIFCATYGLLAPSVTYASFGAGYCAIQNQYLGDDIIGEMFSTYALEAFIYPDSKAGNSMMFSLNTSKAFSREFEDYEIALDQDVLGGTADECAAFVSDLVAAGYTVDQTNPNKYTLSSEQIGEFTYVVYPYSDTYASDKNYPESMLKKYPNSGFGFRVLYKAPEQYQCPLTEEMNNIVEALGLEEDEYDVYNDYYSRMGILIAQYEVLPEGEETLVATEVLEDVVAKLEGYEPKDASQPEYNEKSGYYKKEYVTDGYEITLYVNVPDSTGACLIEIDLKATVSEWTLDSVVEAVGKSFGIPAQYFETLADGSVLCEGIYFGSSMVDKTEGAPSVDEQILDWIDSALTQISTSVTIEFDKAKFIDNGDDTFTGIALTNDGSVFVAVTGYVQDVKGVDYVSFDFLVYENQNSKWAAKKAAELFETEIIDYNGGFIVQGAGEFSGSMTYGALKEAMDVVLAELFEEVPGFVIDYSMGNNQVSELIVFSNGLVAQAVGIFTSQTSIAVQIMFNDENVNEYAFEMSRMATIAANELEKASVELGVDYIANGDGSFTFVEQFAETTAADVTNIGTYIAGLLKQLGYTQVGSNLFVLTSAAASQLSYTSMIQLNLGFSETAGCVVGALTISRHEIGSYVELYAANIAGSLFGAAIYCYNYLPIAQDTFEINVSMAKANAKETLEEQNKFLAFVTLGIEGDPDSSVTSKVTLSGGAEVNSVLTTYTYTTKNGTFTVTFESYEVEGIVRTQIIITPKVA